MIKKEIEPTMPTSVIIKLLLPAILLNLGNYYIYDIPQELAFSFMNQFKKTPEDVSFLYTLYSIPSIPFAFLGGFIVKKLNSSRSSLFATGAILISSLITLLGVQTTSYFLIQIGRVLYGVTGELNMVAQNTILAEWFSGKILSLAIGFNQTVNNLGLTGSYLLTGMLFEYKKGNFLPFFAGFLSCLISFGANLAYVKYDKEFESWKGMKKIKEDYDDGGEEGEDTVHGGIVDLSLFSDLNILFWINVLIANFQSLTYYGFTSFSSECMIKRFGFSLEEAEKMIGMMPLISLFTVPLYSIFIQKKGYKTLLVSFGNFLGVLSFWVLLNIQEKKSNQIYLAFFLLSQFLSVHSACAWTNLAISVRKRAVSVGFGIAAFFGNIFASIFPIFVGKLIKQDNFKGYQAALGLVFKLALVNFLLSFVLIWKDLSQGGVLFYPENSERVKEILRRREQIEDKRRDFMGYEEVKKEAKRHHLIEVI